MESSATAIANVRLVAETADGAEVELSVSPSDYFDERTDDDDPISISSAPRHLEIASYFGLEPKDLRWARVSVEDRASSVARLIEERYWGPGSSCRATRVAVLRDGNLVESELILHLYDPRTGVSHVLRLADAASAVHLQNVSHTIHWSEGGEAKWQAIS